ncbi:MAG: SurA N-terminal domain-containing protein [Acidobacteria bacterium]|nr:SurA N-terminal domain-containing protein [Acidobacteriota bacterium]
MGCRFIAVWLCLGFLPPSTAAAEIIDRILAVVEREIITLSDVNGAMRFGLVDIPRDIEPIQATLDRLIERRLTLTEVERYAPPEPAAAMVDAAVEARRARFADSALFEAALASSGLTADQLRRYLRDDLRIETYLQQRFGAALQPTEAELILYYRDHPAEFTRGAELRPFDEARNEVRARMVCERRALLIRDWLAGLRRRSDVNVLYLPGSSG